MVNSDQTWRRWSNSSISFYNSALLYFAKNWKISKFIYGASLGFSKWKLNKNEEKITKSCLDNFKGISFREKHAIELIKKNLGINATFVLDPTFLIDKKYYINLISNYKISDFDNKSYIFIYLIFKDEKLKTFIKNSSKKLNYSIFRVYKSDNNSVIKFLFGIYNSKCVITDSYHGTVFSIIFRKPFITLFTPEDLNDRFISLGETFNIKNRFIEINKIPDLNLLTSPLNIDELSFNNLKYKSIDYLYKTLQLC